MTITDLTADGTSRTLATADGELHYHEAGEGPRCCSCTVPGPA